MWSLCAFWMWSLIKVWGDSNRCWKTIGLLRYSYQVLMGKLHINTQKTLLLILLTVHKHFSKHGKTILTPQSRTDHSLYFVGSMDPVRMLVTGSVTLYSLICSYNHLLTPHCLHYSRLLSSLRTRTSSFSNRLPSTQQVLHDARAEKRERQWALTEQTLNLSYSLLPGL